MAESYLRFQVSGITGPIQSAKLRLRAGSNGTVDGPAVFTASNTWIAVHDQVDEPAGARHDRDRRRGRIAANATVEYDVKSVVSGNGTSRSP